MRGKVYGELDPGDRRNAIIQDIQLAALNSRRRVEYVATFTLYRPGAGARASVLFVYEVVNRGASLARRDYTTGDIFLQSGWQGDIPFGGKAINGSHGETINGNWLDKYSSYLSSRTTFAWSDSPISRSRLEQLILCRNDFMHHLDCPWQSEDYYEKYPMPVFATREWQNMSATIPALLGVNEEQLGAAIQDVLNFCEYVRSCSKK